MLKRFFDWLFLTRKKDPSASARPEEVTARRTAMQSAKKDFDRTALPYELLRYVVGCAVIVAVSLGFFRMMERVAPYLAGKDTTVVVLGFEFLKHLIWLPSVVTAIFMGAFFRLRKLKKNNEHHLGRRCRELEETLVVKERGGKELEAKVAVLEERLPALKQCLDKLGVVIMELQSVPSPSAGSGLSTESWRLTLDEAYNFIDEMESCPDSGGHNASQSRD